MPGLHVDPRSRSTRRRSALLADFHEALWEDGRRGVRLLTAEENDQSGRPTIVAVSWYDSLEYEARLGDAEDELDS